MEIVKKLIKSISDILKEVFEWVDDGMPGKDDIDLSRYEVKNKNNK